MLQLLETYATQIPGGQGPTMGWAAPGTVREQVPSAFFITPGIAVGVPLAAGAAPVPAGGAVVVGAAGGVVGAGVGAGAGAAVGAGCAGGGPY